jgi:predicted nucleotidyltransferase component of viral defense system
MNATYIEIVRLLLEAIPVVFQEPQFAMKGGTALNLFIQDLPRLSVDIDVVFVDHTASRAEALRKIGASLDAIQSELKRRGLDAERLLRADGDEAKLLLRRGYALVKVEVNHVFRGTILPVQTRSLTPESRRLFTTEVRVPVLATAELYGSKMVAALHRQHPRDLFDVHRLFETGGITDEMVECFVGYLAGHHRPLHEVLSSRDHDLTIAYENEFTGMARTPVSLEQLIQTRDRLRQELETRLTANHRSFLLGLVQGEPDWGLMRCGHLAELPAIRWKIQNLAKLRRTSPQKHAEQSTELRAIFGA